MKSLFLLLLLLIPSLAFSQGLQIPPPVGTPRALATPGTVMTKASGDTFGNVLISMNANGAIIPGTGATSLGKAEDSVAGDGDTIVPAGVVARSAVVQTASASGDYVVTSADLGNRILTTKAPAGETGTSCSAEATGTALTAILGAVASNRWYVTSINCSNNSPTPSRITFRDGAADKAVGGVAALATNGGGLSLTFDPPIRGSVNTAFNFIMTTTATATICCATAYFSTI